MILTKNIAFSDFFKNEFYLYKFITEESVNTANNYFFFALLKYPFF